MTLNQLAIPPISGKYRALLDSDILLELLSNRSPFVEEAEHLFEHLREDNSVQLYITDRALRRIVYEHKNFQHALKVADYFQKSFEQNIIQVSDFIKTQSREVKFPDFESAIEHACAEEYELDAIITQNPSNYPNASIPIWSVSKLEEEVVLENLLAVQLKNSLLHEHFLAEQKNDCSIPELIDSNISFKHSNSDSQPDCLLERRLMDVKEEIQQVVVDVEEKFQKMFVDVEGKFQQMFVEEEERRRSLETLVREKINTIEEKTTQSILKMFEFERQKRETFSQSDYLLERRLMDVEEKIQKMFVEEEDRRRRFETLIRQKNNAIEESQDAHQSADASDSIGVSLEEMCSFLKPSESQLTEVE